MNRNKSVEKLEGNNPETLKKRLGHIVRKKDIPFEKFIANECKKRNIELLFDLNDVESDRDCLIYTEFFGGLGGVMLRPQNFTRQLKMYYASLQHSCDVKVDFPGQVLKAGDKYKLGVNDKTYEKVALLPGSNMLGTHTKKELVQKAVDSGAFLKPHPITTGKVLELLDEFWYGKVLPKESSGFNLFINAKEIWTTRYSEFSLFSILTNKKFNFIDEENIANRGSYKSLNLALEIFGAQNSIGLNKILNSYKSGVFFREFNIEKDIIDFLDFFEKEILGRE